MNIKQSWICSKTFANGVKIRRRVGGSIGITRCSPCTIDYDCDRRLGIGEEARGEIVGQIQGLVGRMERKSSRRRLKMPTSHCGDYRLVISVVVLSLEHLGYLRSFKMLSTPFGRQPKPGRGIINIIQPLLSFTMVLALAFTARVTLVSAALTALINFFGHMLPGIDFIWQIANFILSLLLPRWYLG